MEVVGEGDWMERRMFGRMWVVGESKSDLHKAESQEPVGKERWDLQAYMRDGDCERASIVSIV